ncbi:MAG: cell surface protein [Actinomycetaceae bacterium]|nr:cell surface protein [Actinomycetaceae bacterium]
MALFEFDNGHLVPAQFGRPVTGGVQDEVLDSVRQQVLEVISRPLFPVTWSDPAPVPVSVQGMPLEDIASEEIAEGEGTLPRLTALDGSGQVVSIEVLDILNSQTLIAALARLGRVSSLGWNELAAVYPGGVPAFRAGWTQFRDSMPPKCDPGPRLILVATQIDPDVRPALEALASSGLEVHNLSVREMSNGRTFLDVQKVHSSLFGHDTTLLPGRAARLPELSAWTEDDARAQLEAQAGTQVPAMPSVPFAEASIAPETSEVPAPAAHEDDDESVTTGTISRHSIMQAAMSKEPAHTVVQEKVEDAPVDEPVAPEATEATSETEPVAEDGPTLGAPEEDAAVPSAPPSENVENVEKTEEVVEAVREPAGHAGEAVEFAWITHTPEGLAMLASIIDGDAPLCAQVGEGPVIEAGLRRDGVVIVEDGRTWNDPEAALRELSRDLGLEQAWEAWHLGDLQGPSLAEACAEMNAEIERSSATETKQARH